MFGNPEVNPHVRHDMEEQWERAHRGHRILGVALLLLTLAIAGGGWYAYQALRRHEVALTQVPGVQKFVDAIGDRVKQTDQKLASWADDQQSLRDQMAKLGQKMETRVASATKQAQVSWAEMYRRTVVHGVSRRTGARLRPLHVRVFRAVQKAAYRGRISLYSMSWHHGDRQTSGFSPAP